MEQLTIGVDLGGTKIAAALVDASGSVLAEARRPTEAEAGVDRVIANIEAIARDVAGGSFAQVGAIGLGAPGPLNRRDGVIHSAANLPGWENTPIVARLEARLGLPIILENDGNAAAYGEWRVGAGRGTRDLIYLTISTGIGGGFILNGRIYRGRDDGAGEVGHMILMPEGPVCGCGRRGCWEALSSGTAIAKAMRERLEMGAESRFFAEAAIDPRCITAAQVAEAAREGDAEAQAVLARSFFYLAVGLVNLIHLLNPEIIVIGGGVAKLGEQLFGPVSALANELAFPMMVKELPIVPAALGDRAGPLGAALVASDAP